MRRSTCMASLVLALAGGLLAGCGDDGAAEDQMASAGGRVPAAAPSASAPTNDPAALAKCLRDNGLDVKDPEPGSGQLTLPEPGPLLEAAMKKCERYGVGLTQRTGVDVNDPDQQERRLKFASCMREQGVDWPDPKPGEPMEMPQQTPQFMTAFEKCTQSVPPAGGR
ncbi:MAG: hypothetical protein SYR96_08010 [Actinomycetota bacterium]|nr:hypothetical protein [Actinomycetota bacterium]